MLVLVGGWGYQTAHDAGIAQRLEQSSPGLGRKGGVDGNGEMDLSSQGPGSYGRSIYSGSTKFAQQACHREQSLGIGHTAGNGEQRDAKAAPIHPASSPFLDKQIGC